MNDQEINTLIAEACGWENVHKPGFPGLSLGLPPKNWPRRADPFPNYYGKHYEIPYFCRDLNAMHDAEKVLPYYPDYLFHLREIVGPFPEAMSEWGDHDWADVVRATARQRAEAFLRTIGKWKEGE